MSSDPGAVRKLRWPGSDFAHRAVPVTRHPRRPWYRVYWSGSAVLTFARQAHHRFSHPECPYGVLYLGATLETCLWEVFGDGVLEGQPVIAESRWRGVSAARVTLPELRVCDCEAVGTREVMGVDRASLLAVELAVPQAWGLAVQRHPAGFQALEYGSRFVNDGCLALFDRDGLSEGCKVVDLGALEQVDAAMNWLEARRVALV